jgi:hypothetical protein
MPITEEQAQLPLSADLLAILRCLSCGAKLESDSASGFVFIELETRENNCSAD